VQRTPIQSIRQFGWPGGWQADKPASHVQVDELDYIMNMNWTEGYGLERRGGFEQITNDPAGLDEANQMHVRYVHTSASLAAQPSFTQQVLYFNDDDGEVWNATMGQLLEQEQFATGADLTYSGQSIGNWSTTSTNFYRTYPIASFVFEEFIYITALRFGGYSGVSTAETHNGAADGASKPIKYDVLNGTWTRLAPHALDGTTSGLPSARCAISAYDRVFVGNIYSQGTYRYPSRIYFSEAGTAETFETNSYLTVGLDDGSEITNIVKMGEGIFITKDDSCWLLLGTDEDTFQLREINPRQGTRSSQACLYFEGKVYFFDQSYGLIEYDGANFRNVSEPINNTMLSDFNHEVDFKANLQAHGERLYLSLPVGSGLSDTVGKTYVYDTKLKVWTQWDFGIPTDIVEYVTDHDITGVGLAGTGDGYFATPDGTEKGIFRLDASAIDDDIDAGAAVVSGQFTTGWFSPGEVGFKHRLRRLDLITSATSTSNIDITLYRDFDPTTSFGTATFDPDGALDAWHYQSQGFDHKTDMWTWLQLDVVIDQTVTVAEVHGYQYAISSRPWRRGVQGNLNQAP
jgi:hypothetical protein